MYGWKITPAKVIKITLLIVKFSIVTRVSSSFQRNLLCVYRSGFDLYLLEYPISLNCKVIRTFGIQWLQYVVLPHVKQVTHKMLSSLPHVMGMSSVYQPSFFRLSILQ